MANGAVTRTVGVVATLLMLADGGLKVGASNSNDGKSPDYKYACTTPPSRGAITLSAFLNPTQPELRAADTTTTNAHRPHARRHPHSLLTLYPPHIYPRRQLFLQA
jgi:hypothetical protein